MKPTTDELSTSGFEILKRLIRVECNRDPLKMHDLLVRLTRDDLDLSTISREEKLILQMGFRLSVLHYYKMTEAS